MPKMWFGGSACVPSIGNPGLTSVNADCMDARHYVRGAYGLRVGGRRKIFLMITSCLSASCLACARILSVP